MVKKNEARFMSYFNAFVFIIFLLLDFVLNKFENLKILHVHTHRRKNRNQSFDRGSELGESAKISRTGSETRTFLSNTHEKNYKNTIYPYIMLSQKI